ncbi:MAG: ABC transporter substrate-binding protein, partial [Chloroflexota bacterium]
DPKVSKVVGKVAIGPEPAQPGVEPKNMTGNWLLGIPEGSKNAEQALDFIVWITSAEQQKRLLLNNNVPATRTSVLTDAEAVKKLPFLPGLLEAARKAVPRPRTPHYNAVEAIYGRYIAEAIAGQTSPDDALKNANKEIRDLMVREGVIQE